MSTAVASLALALRATKALAVLVALANVHSWPFVWHLRLFRPAYYARARSWLFQLSILWRPRSVRAALTAARLDSLSPIGQSPFDIHETYSTWAGPDDCDFLLHLSNSSYPKTLDLARFKTALRYFPTLFRAGGSVPLGGTHFSFLREIPVGARYDVRVSVASWDHKWVYVLARFVTRARMRAEPDGATLHCVAVSALCIKMGRITVPPALVFAAEGLCGAHARGADAGHWAHVRALRGEDGLRTLRGLFAGGWREVPAGERWWEDALGGEVEARRAAGMKIVEGLRGGMAGLKGMQTPQ